MADNQNKPSIGVHDDSKYEFIVNNPDQKKFQDNFLFNERIFSYVTHTGMGYSKYTDEDDFNTNIIHGTIDNQQYENSRMIYIRDNKTKEYWSVGWEPICKPYEKYECRIGLNYTTISNRTDGVECKWTIFVPMGSDPVEMWDVTIISEEKRDLSVFFFTELSLITTINTYGHDGYMSATFNESSNAITVSKSAQALREKLNAISCIPSIKPNSYTGSRFDFFGMYRTPANPIALLQDKLPDTAASKERVCAAFQFNFELEGTVRLNNIIIGHNNLEDISQYKNKYSNFNVLFEETRKYILNKFGHLKINTGIASIDRITNTWNKQMIAYGQAHCRWGIKGYRDLVQHSQGGLYFDSDLSRQNIIKCLSYQKSDGFSVRSFPVVYEDSKMHYSDSASWLIYAVTEYLKETGDFEFLKMKIAYLDEGEATVLEHLDLIVESLFKDRGEHGLVKIHGGDWNDSLTHVGKQGRGESVWLTMFLAKCLLLMEELKNYLKLPHTKYMQMYGIIKDAINRYAWDGEWYIRAFDDNGEKIGAKENTEGKIFLNTQSWAIIAGIADGEKIQIIKSSINKFLLSDYGYMLNYPTFTKLHENIGRMTVMEPGTAENGSVYMHGNAFLMYAFLTIGETEAAYDILKTIKPDNPNYDNDAICPYIYGNCYYGPANKKEYGKMEFSWITGSANWILQSIVELMLGVRRTYDGIVLKPNIPAEMKNVEIYREYRGNKYHIVFENNGQNVQGISFNGINIDASRPLPVSEDLEEINEVVVRLTTDI